MQILGQILEQIEGRIRAYSGPREPEGLYAPVGYIMTLGGKRIRPLLCAAGYLVDRPELEERVLDACLALELFHNFSLVHDDIMDEAPLRRGKPTVHERWNVPTAILAGDVMLIDVYEQLRMASLPGQLSAVLRCFHGVAVGVCEGQQRDMAFEQAAGVTWDAYLEMIRGKTAVLLGGSLELGGLLAGMDHDRAVLLGRLGEALGLAFQLEDDWLDAFGDPALTGKQPGGDILRGKKTALYVMSMAMAGAESRLELERWFDPGTVSEPQTRVQAVLDIFERSGSREAVAARAAGYHEEALGLLDQLDGRGPGATLIRHLVGQLKGRKH
jgi:geranylgeranyl diphosphate synthase, type II